MGQKTFEDTQLRTVIDEDREPHYLGDKDSLQARDWDRMQKAREGWEQESLRKWE